MSVLQLTTVSVRREKVVHIPDIVKEPETSLKIVEFDKILEIMAEKLNEHKVKIESNTEMNIQMKKLAKEVLTKQREEINKFFDDLEKKMDLQVENIQMDNIAALKTASDKLGSMGKELKEMKTSIDSIKKGQNCELFIAMKKNKQKIETLNEHLNKLSDETRIQKYKLLPSEQIEAMMRNITEISRLTTARFQAKIDVSSSKDKKIPTISGLTTVHGYFCVVTDYNNKSVKVVDTVDRCLTSEIVSEAEHILGLTTVKNDCVAVSVSLNCNHQIQFFSVSSSGVITTTAKLFSCTRQCWDLEYCNDNLFLSQRDHIRICNMTRHEIKTIEHDSAGVAMLQFPIGISLNLDGKIIYETDLLKHSVTSIALDGNVNAVYEDGDLKKPRGITVDNDGYVYVCSSGTGSIHQLMADLSRVQIIIEDVDARAITFSSTQNKLYLSDGKCVSIYDLMTHYKKRTCFLQNQ